MSDINVETEGEPRLCANFVRNVKHGKNCKFSHDEEKAESARTTIRTARETVVASGKDVRECRHAEECRNPNCTFHEV
jgi:hypothetical protein